MPKRGRLFVILITLIAILSSASIALAQDPTQGGVVVPLLTDPTWQAVYWNNPNLSGTPVLQRSENNLDYDWGYGSPDGVVPADNFSARWSRYIELAAGTYRFTATSDDGIRVSVNGNTIINKWYDHGVETYTADISLPAGDHLVVVEYYERTQMAVARLSWGAAPSAIYNWQGEYFNNRDLSGSPVLVRDDANINFNWGSGSPAPGVVPEDSFSVRWTRNVSFSAGYYQFTVTVDDGARLWVNNHLLIDSWRDQGATTYTAQMYVPAGSIPIRLEYYENSQGAVIQLSWTGSGGGTVPPVSGGEIVVDDTDPGFERGGLASSWRVAYEGYGGQTTWTLNNDYARANYNWARWYPNLAARRYEVFVYIPDRYTTTGSANYWVSHTGGYTRRIVSQSATGTQWVSLGTYDFTGTRSDYVSLADPTGEPRLSRIIGFDAVKWVPR